MQIGEVVNVYGKKPLGFVLVDVSWILYKGFFAFKHFAVNDHRTGHFFYVIKLISQIFHAYPRTAVILCMDRYPKRKHEMFAEYKAGREHAFDLDDISKTICDAVSQVPGVYAAYADNEEADDLLATLSWSTDSTVVVFSGDDDLLQIVGSRIRVARKFEDNNFILLGPKYCYKRFGVPPSDVLMYRALRGDRSDRIPGVCKRFPKRVARHLAIQFKFPHQIIQHKIPTTKDKTLIKYWKKVKERPKSLSRNYELMKLTNVPYEIYKTDDREGLVSFIQRYKMRSMKGLYNNISTLAAPVGNPCHKLDLTFN